MSRHCTAWRRSADAAAQSDSRETDSFGYRRSTVSADTPDPSTDTQAGTHAGTTAGAPAEAGPPGSGLVAEKARRLAQIAELRDAGVDPYPYRFDRTHQEGGQAGEETGTHEQALYGLSPSA